jgi:hypothetical protein
MSPLMSLDLLTIEAAIDFCRQQLSNSNSNIFDTLHIIAYVHEQINKRNHKS